MALLLLIGLAVGYHSHQSRPVPLERDLKTVPAAIGNWRGYDIHLQNVPFRIDGAHDELARIYQNRGAPAVILYIGYLESQEQGRELVNYHSRKLLLGASTVSVLTEDGRSRALKRTVFQAGQQTYFALFWYELSGAVAADPYRVKLWTIWGAMARRKTNGAMVAVFIELKRDSNLQRTYDQGISFVRELTPTLENYLPR